MKSSQPISRRQVLQLGAGLAAVPWFVPARVLGEDAPSKKITLGMIGIGWMGGSNMNGFLREADCRVLACCDLDQEHLQAAIRRVNEHYKNQDCRGYKDFRELLARDDIDAVCISTPDHWHSIPAIAAAKAKKDIYCEKPLSHTFAEGLAMVKAVQENGRIWQTGSWQRSVPDFRRATLLVLNGYIGKVKRVEVGLPSGHTDFAGTGKDCPNSDPPPHVDYNFWVGPAQMLP
ncbi:MAG TPA: Gfo/Idh/MocA family oxidoreductase, partial [Thermoguttaceae bacterium]|nr:Gfo/Idh/MocA family oxidoreductase [Thermoguttaceae bacterium]